MLEGKLDAAGCGSMVVDLFYRTPRFIAADEKILLRAHGPASPVEQMAVGGLVLNHLGWARVLGLRTGIFGKLGDDRNGEFLREAMNRFGIRQSLTLDGDASAFATVFVDKDGNRAIYMSRGATGELTPDEIRHRHAAFIRNAHLITTEISQLPLRTVIAILQIARAAKVPTILDLDLPPSDAIASLGTASELSRALRLATYLKPAKSAARELAPDAKDPIKMAEQLRAKYRSRAVIITEGDRGCSIATREGSFHSPAFKVRQVDATGAGDAFLGAIACGLRLDLGWENTARLANAAGAVCVTRLGAFPESFDLRREIAALYGAPIPDAHREDARAARALESRNGDAPEVEAFFAQALDELGAMREQLNTAAISRAVEVIRTALGRGGRVHVTGVGKPEHVARYAASLLCSIGTPATFLHATETLHGSLGQVHPRDVVIAISNSGATDELLTTATAIRDHGAQLIAVTGSKDSNLAQIADLVIHAPIANEGGGLGLAPRISVLGQVMVLAGLSVALEVAHGLTVEEYSRWHRAGALGAAARKIANGANAPRGAKSR